MGGGKSDKSLAHSKSARICSIDYIFGFIEFHICAAPFEMPYIQDRTRGRSNIYKYVISRMPFPLRRELAMDLYIYIYMSIPAAMSSMWVRECDRQLTI